MKIIEGKSVTEVKHGIILQQVNCQGVMGSGVAAAIRSKWPIVFDEYSHKCKATSSSYELLGQMNATEVEPKLFVVNLFGQLSYGRESKRYTSYDALDDALNKTAAFMIRHGIQSFDVHHPAIGAGLGNGHWPTISSLIDYNLGSNTTLWLYP